MCFIEQCYHRAETSDKPSIKIGEAQEPQQLLYQLGLWPLRDRFHLPVIHDNPLRADSVAKQGELCDMELTFLSFVICVMVRPLVYCLGFSQVLGLGISPLGETREHTRTWEMKLRADPESKTTETEKHWLAHETEL